MPTASRRKEVPVSEPTGTVPWTAVGKRQAVQAMLPSRHLWHSGPGAFVARLGIGLGLLVIVLSLCAPLLAPYDPMMVDLHTGLQRPSLQHWLGTDPLGRDVWSRLLWAGQASLGVAAVVLAVTVTVGMSIGLLAGYAGGRSEDMAMRLVDLFSALPSLIVTLALIGMLGPSLPTLILALSLTGWTFYARLTRSLVLRTRTQEFVLAAYALGASPRRILWQHVLPAVLGPVSVQLSLNVGGIILAIAGLSFLGLGIQPPTPEWGTMLVDARPFLASAPHLVLPPGLAIFLLVFGCNACAELLAQRHYT